MNQEVILKGPVKGLGAEADLVRVKPGYARNFLFPRGLASPVNAASKRQIDSLKKWPDVYVQRCTQLTGTNGRTLDHS